MKPRIDLDSTESKHKGLKGLFESLLRRFKTGMQILTMLPMYFCLSLILALALTPSVFIWRTISQFVTEQPTFVQNFSYALALSLGYLSYGFSILFILPVANLFLGRGLKEWRGSYYSAESIRWFMHNGLTYVARFTFLEFVTPSPIGLLFYKMMGMKIGDGTIINSTWISDPSLIEMGEKVTIGGSVTIVAHYGQGGLLIISPVKIGSKSTIGLKATLMGGVVIGEGAKILPHSVVLPKTIVPAGETWGGVPAQKIEIHQTLVQSLKAS